MPLKAIPTQKANLWLRFHECKFYLMVWTPGLVYIWHRTNYHFRDFFIFLLLCFVFFRGKGNISGCGTSCHSCFHSFVFCQMVIWFHVQPFTLSSEPVYLGLKKKKRENLVKYWFNCGVESTHTSLCYVRGRREVRPFSHVGEYPCIFKCEIYCRGILNFNCDAFNRTLCALTT